MVRFCVVPESTINVIFKTIFPASTFALNFSLIIYFHDSRKNETEILIVEESALFRIMIPDFRKKKKKMV